MATGVLILGESGTGKSASLRNFQKHEVGIINVVGKPLPFKNNLQMANTDNYIQIEKILKASHTKTVVIDDAQYLLCNEFMRRTSEVGFQKFTDIAKNFWTLINMIGSELPQDMIVYFLAHTERDANGNEKMKTIGKLLDEKITVEGMFSIVLKTTVENGNYYFSTKNSGHDTVKSPIGLFQEELIPNDLKAVDDAIRKYYGLAAYTGKTPVDVRERNAKAEAKAEEKKEEVKKNEKA